jgi:uncharacterized protein (TIGR00299 family) protein
VRVAYFDAVSGAAGDMILGTLIDAGLDLQRLRRELARLPVAGYTVSSDRVRKQHVTATQFRVDAPSDRHHHHGPPTGHALPEILELIDRSSLSEAVRHRACAIFRTIGVAEAKVHGVDLDDVHFHEVGETDSIVDIVGASIALELMEVERVYCSSLPLGTGTIQTSHGVFPIPAPATLQILANVGAPTRPGVAGAEQVTPTGAAILTTVGTFEQPAMRVRSVGYGAGESDLSIPNVLRVWLGDADDLPSVEELCTVETNLDDMQPELLAHVSERCLEEGALDVLMLPATMKKGRPGTKLEVLCDPGIADGLVQLLLRETTTLGVRVHRDRRYRAERTVQEILTPYGPVTIKVKLIGGRAVGMAPEYEACRRVALERAVPLLEVYSAALDVGRALLHQEG